MYKVYARTPRRYPEDPKNVFSSGTWRSGKLYIVGVLPDTAVVLNALVEFMGTIPPPTLELSKCIRSEASLIRAVLSTLVDKGESNEGAVAFFSSLLIFCIRRRKLFWIEAISLFHSIAYEEKKRRRGGKVRTFWTNTKRYTFLV